MPTKYKDFPQGINESFQIKMIIFLINNIFVTFLRRFIQLLKIAILFSVSHDILFYIKAISVFKYFSFLRLKDILKF